MDQARPVATRIASRLAVHVRRGLIAWAALATGLAIVPAAADEPYFLAPGDRVTVTVFDQPDISGSYVIEPSGEITLPLLGAVGATTLTPGGLQSELVKRFSDGYLQNPVISVRLAELRPVTIVGKVRGSGRYAFVNGLTVGTALALAGGTVRAPNEEAGQRLEILRVRERLDGLRLSALSQRVRRARLEAQVRNETSFKDPEGGPENAALLARLAAGEHQVLEFDAAALASQIELLKERIHILESDIQAGTDQANLEKDQITNLDTQLQDSRGLLASGLTRKPMVLDLQREKSKSQANLSRIMSEVARSKSALAEATLRIGDLVTTYHDRAASDLQAVIVRQEEIQSALPLVQEDLRTRQEQLPFASEGTEKPTVFRITRYTKGTIETITANAGTALRPGDILEAGEGAGGADAAVTDRLPEPGAGDGDGGLDQPASGQRPARSGPDRLSQR